MANAPQNEMPDLLSPEDRLPTFDRVHKIMSMFSNNAKTYIQLSGAGLALTLTFSHQILRIPETDNIANVWMILVWLCFLIAIVTGAFYQYLAVKLLERQINWQYSEAFSCIEPGTVYGVMLGTFYGGTIIFTVYAIVRMYASR